jgi:predicted transglutaminase-like cysteine proteinase
LASVLALLAGFTAAQTIGPAGFYDLCTAYQAECQPVVQTQSLTFNDVGRINRLVNQDIRPQPEPAGTDIWTIGPRDGDCEDYAMTKRHDLIAAGLGSDRARVAVGVAKGGQLHAVLVVNFGPNFYVLDNLTDEVLLVERSDVRIASIQSLENPRVWLKAP